MVARRGPGRRRTPVERPAYSGERARAAALDLALLTVLWAIVVYFASRAAHVELMGLRPAWPYLAGYLAFLGLSYAGYFTGTTGQTLGKIAVGLRVVDAGGRPPGTCVPSSAPPSAASASSPRAPASSRCCSIPRAARFTTAWSRRAS